MKLRNFESMIASHEREIVQTSAQAEALRKSGYPLSADALDRRVLALQKSLRSLKAERAQA